MPKNTRSIAQQLAFNRDLEYKRLRQQRAKDEALARVGLVIRCIDNHTDEYYIDVCDYDLYAKSLELFRSSKDNE